MDKFVTKHMFSAVKSKAGDGAHGTSSPEPTVLSNTKSVTCITTKHERVFTAENSVAGVRKTLRTELRSLICQCPKGHLDSGERTIDNSFYPENKNMSVVI